MKRTPFRSTPYPDVNAVLLRLRAEMQAVLGERLVGLYLYGSLALGDFDPVKSDIDFLAVTEDDLSGEQLAALQAMHLHLAQGVSKWWQELEGSYIPKEAVRRYDPARTLFPHIDRGSGVLEVRQHDTDWIIQRYSARRYGVILLGPDPGTLIDPISPDDLRAAVRGLLWWWELQLTETQRVAQSGYQTYAVLSMCRILYTLRYGTITTKPRAARWALRVLPARWSGLIERALTWQPDQPMDRLNETLDFIRYTLARSRPGGRPSP